MVNTFAQDKVSGRNHFRSKHKGTLLGQYAMGVGVPLGFTGLWFEPDCNRAIRGPIGSDWPSTNSKFSTYFIPIQERVKLKIKQTKFHLKYQFFFST